MRPWFFRTSRSAPPAEGLLPQVAAAVAASLFAQGVPASPTPEVVAAIVSAWALRRRSQSAVPQWDGSSSAWKVAGRTLQMVARVNRQERPFFRAA